MSTEFSVVSWGWPGKRRVLISWLLQPAWSGGSGCRPHCGARPSIPHQAKMRPQISCVSKTLSLAVLGGSAKGVATHWPVASYSLPWKGQTSRPPRMRPPRRAPGRSPGARNRPRRRRPARPRHTGDDVLPHPGLLDELGLQHGLTARNEVPALGKWGRQRGGRGLAMSGCQCQAFPTMSLKSATSLPVNAPSQGSSTA